MKTREERLLQSYNKLREEFETSQERKLNNIRDQKQNVLQKVVKLKRHFKKLESDEIKIGQETFLSFDEFKSQSDQQREEALKEQHSEEHPVVTDDEIMNLSWSNELQL